MEFSTCPICKFTVPSFELERHANEHFADDDNTRDFELAQKIASTPSSPPRLAEDLSECIPNSMDNPQNSSSGNDATINTTSGESNYYEKYPSLVCPTNMASYYKVEGSLMPLLRKCLESDPDNSTSILCGYVEHCKSLKSEDSGWGCGWRNIQMLSSHLLSQRQEAREVLFAGCGFVPGILTLQKWLEIAWTEGFDRHGSVDFGMKIHGRRNWIGTTECAALFRSFGLRARIVDFLLKDSVKTDKNVERRKIAQVYGPMDVFMSKGKLDSSLAVLSSDKVKVDHPLIEWVWEYFSDNKVKASGNRRVVLSEKSPLYFQQEGHSRTIVGIQAKPQKNGAQQYNLLIFDPGEDTRSLEKSLRENRGWKSLIKRGATTLKELQYQLCYIDPGIAQGEELEKLKILHSIRHEV